MSRFALALMGCFGVLAAATPGLGRSRGDGLVTFHVQIGRNGAVIAESDLRVSGDDISSLSRSWPVEGTATCTPRAGTTRYAAAGNSVWVSLEPVRPSPTARRRESIAFVRVRGSWREFLAMPTGVVAGDCGTWPTHRGESEVSRVLPIDLAQPVTLTGDDGLFVIVSRLP